jgi:hypothetical protein
MEHLMNVANVDATVRNNFCHLGMLLALPMQNMLCAPSYHQKGS